MINSYLQLLKDSSKPVNRVARNTAILSIIISIVLLIYRHVIFEFNTIESLFISICLVFVTLVFLGYVGAVIAGGAYEILIKIMNINTESRFKSFILEWLFALLAPLLLYIFFTTISYMSDYA